jgi:hypothetical protein
MKEKKSKRPYLRCKTNKTTGLEGKWESKNADASNRSSEKKEIESTTLTGFKDPSFWK